MRFAIVKLFPFPGLSFVIAMRPGDRMRILLMANTL
jgi:hypothetical protein